MSAEGARAGVGCPSCGREVSPDLRFCVGCGRAIPTMCHRCGRPSSPGDDFCGGCGARLAPAGSTDPSTAEGERKQVTVLFCDVQQSTELQQDLDAEEWRRILNQLVGIFTAAIHRYQGTVDKFTGDGIMAIFGAPIALEDHARRACSAALHLQHDVAGLVDDLARSRGISLALRTGLNSGDVVVGGIGDGLDMNYTAIGATVTLAKRMEALAAPGTVCLSEATARLVQGFFALDDLGPQEAKGFAEPVKTYRLAGSAPFRAPIEVARERGFSRFVGRSTELAVLDGALDRALVGEGQLVAIVGEAGVGKSRLCDEFVQTCRARGITVRQTAAVAHERPIPYLAVIQLLRGFFDLTPDASATVVRGVVTERLLSLGIDRDDISLLHDLLGAADATQPLAPIDPEVRERRLLAVIIRMTHARSALEPVVLVIEDLHWLDGASATVIAHYLRTLPPYTLLVVNFRPEYEASFVEHNSSTRLFLTPLAAEATAEMLDDLVGADSSVGPLRQTIAGRAEGNPFFLEELVLGLWEQHALEGVRGNCRLTRSVDNFAIPPTVHATIASRIDRLAKRDKYVLEVASVIGRETPVRLLAHASRSAELDASLAALVQAELLRPTAAQEPTYEFRHALTRQVAYETQLSENRVRRHGDIATAVQELDPALLDENAPLIAHHYEHAHQKLDAAAWHGRAAGWIGIRNVAEAQSHWQTMLTLLADSPEESDVLELRARAHVGLIRSAYWQDTRREGQSAVLEEGIALARRLEDASLTAALLIMCAGWIFMIGDVPRSVELAREALVASEAAGDPGLTAWITAIEVWFLSSGGWFEEASDIAERTHRIVSVDTAAGRQWAGYRPEVFLNATLGLVMIELGRPAEAEQLLRRAIASSDESSEAFPRMAAQAFLGLVAHARGDAEGILDEVTSSVELASRGGSAGQEIFTTIALAAARCSRAEWAEAAALLGPALELMRSRGVMHPWEALALALLAQAKLGLGSVHEAGETAQEAIAVARTRGTPTCEIRGQLALAAVALQADAPEAPTRVTACLDRALHLMSETGARLYEPSIHELRGRLLRKLGDPGAGAELAQAHRLYAESNASGHARRLAVELA